MRRPLPAHSSMQNGVEGSNTQPWPVKRQADEGEDDEEGAVEVAVLQVLLDAAVMAPCVDKGGHLEDESEEDIHAIHGLKTRESVITYTLDEKRHRARGVARE